MSLDIRSRLNELPPNLSQVRERIRLACLRSGRRPEEVTLIAVTKTLPAVAVNAVVSLGVTDIGENRVQEAREKIASAPVGVRWHLIGHLQSNKVRDAVRLFDMIHTVDSIPLAEKISRHASSQDKHVDLLLQVNIGDEAQKSGVRPEESLALAQAVLRLASVRLRGLMTIPPVADDEQTRRYFRQMCELKDDVRRRLGQEDFRSLSMGMSADYEIAIEEGATMIRVGSALFGSRI